MNEPLPDGTFGTGHADYDELPRSIKDRYTLKQYLWLSSDQKAHLVTTECEPEHTE